MRTLTLPIAERAQALLDLSATNHTANHDTNHNPPAIPEAMRQAAMQALRRGETHYTDRPGIAPLRQHVANWLNSLVSGLTSADGVVITCGLTEARFVVLQRLLESQQSLIVSSLAAKQNLQAAARIRDVQLQLASDITPSQASANTGVLYLSADDDPAALAPWLAQAREQGWWLVYERNLEPTATPATTGVGLEHPAHYYPELAARTVSIGAIGQNQGLESWRIGFLAASEQETSPLRSFKQALTICTTSLSQWGALALWESA